MSIRGTRFCCFQAGSMDIVAIASWVCRNDWGQSFYTGLPERLGTIVLHWFAERLGTIVLHWFAERLGTIVLHWFAERFGDYSLVIVTRMFLNIGVRDFGSTTRGTSTLDSG